MENRIDKYIEYIKEKARTTEGEEHKRYYTMLQEAYRVRKCAELLENGIEI